MSKKPEKYLDILECTRPESAYPPMSMEDRAAQFAPFAALTGHSEAIEETAIEVQEHVSETGMPASELLRREGPVQAAHRTGTASNIGQT